MHLISGQTASLIVARTCRSLCWSVEEGGLLTRLFGPHELIVDPASIIRQESLPVLKDYAPFTAQQMVYLKVVIDGVALTSSGAVSVDSIPYAFGIPFFANYSRFFRVERALKPTVVWCRLSSGSERKGVRWNSTWPEVSFTSGENRLVNRRDATIIFELLEQRSTLDFDPTSAWREKPDKLWVAPERHLLSNKAAKAIRI